MRRNIEREEYLGTLATLQALLAQPVPVEAGSGAMQPLASSYLARLSRHETDAVVTATRDFFRKACEARAGNGQPLDPSIFVETLLGALGGPNLSQAWDNVSSCMHSLEATTALYHERARRPHLPAPSPEGGRLPVRVRTAPHSKGHDRACVGAAHAAVPGEQP
ncbi:hypothetical protein DMC30DRAFT_96029 [Rhodotorula diobovata]|uniref:Uncharacterized protein n=1 Tax=Rhodotorula diobovata TaxID=5288 RepID=A0A5C5FN60_9BASI|nr:hypothetical protein DMC30DRAFT_96029 [Rhodotorula diobovata]